MLQTNDTPDSLILSVTESIHLNSILAKRFSKSTCSSTAERSKKCNESEKSEDVRVDQDGSLHTIEEPCISDENVRRSTRKITVRVRYLVRRFLFYPRSFLIVNVAIRDTNFLNCNEEKKVLHML